MKKAALLIFCLIAQSVCYAQAGGKRLRLGKEYAEKELADALHNTNKRQVLVSKVIKNKATAIKVAEAILLSIYGQEQIERQRPYENYLIDGYWVIKGTLPYGRDGGTFMIILNSVDGQVIKLEHGQ